MKKNSGAIYNFYKEWKHPLDVFSPIVLAILGMLLGFYVKKKLFMFGIEESVSSGVLATLTAAPVALYNRIINNYASKIQEDKDFDEIAKKNKQIAYKNKQLNQSAGKIKKLQSEKVKAYKAHKKNADKIQKILNQPGVDDVLRANICNIIHDGDGDVFSIAISHHEIEVNEEPYGTKSSSSERKFSSQTSFSEDDIN